jgi:hypothetical protein
MTLEELQRRVGAAIMAPLARHDEISTEWQSEADQLIKPNDRLAPLERLEIYSRSYWFRVIDCMYDDFPGLAAALGPRAFDKIVRAYLADRPSQSFTLRNLGEGLEEWLKAHPDYAGSHLDLAIDMIRLEWAHVEAFDGEERKPLGPEDLLELGGGLRVGLQPHLSLLVLRYPVDDLRIEANQSIEDHDSASNAPTSDATERKAERARRSSGARYRRMKPRPVHVAVYRSDGVVYYRRLDAGEHAVLLSLRAGHSVESALEMLLESAALAGEDGAELAASIQSWFSSWAEMGWLTALASPE